ncbi:GNAT family N-acetyltransferase [Acinetobacter gerneri]|jgi:GNAT superfamily N-acetyltransferase|uniref:GNAT family N-acetyltransferase n=1 Tax=Acinetobacter gerneri TaxID=202952 RepID=UPI0023F1D498|nr:GNAT family N-acetyltransferase [Acinetobacter gerneri]MCH4245241.1 GNAT family N-acetyltransferase [Acinetobacter gerneri]
MQITLREIRQTDLTRVSELLTELGYQNTENFMAKRIAQILDHPDEYCYVAENEGQIVGMISVSIILQIALSGDFARISYLVIDEKYRGLGIGHLLEEKCLEVAKLRKCVRIELHCHERRKSAHQFYYALGYAESPKYLYRDIM